MFDDFLDEEEFTDADDNAPSSAASLHPPRDTTVMLGADALEKTLLSLYNSKTLPHALIFAGPMGVGKATMAFRLARFLLKHGAGADDNQDSLFGDAPPAPSTMDVSPEDPVFHRIASGGHPDLRYIERAFDEKKGVKKGVVDVDSIRGIAPFLRKTTAEGGWRIVIVDEADSMNRQSQNAILKILEEPPQRALLILICNRLGSMLPTIRSRCRTFHFAPLSGDALTTMLARVAPGSTAAELNLLAAMSDGSIGRALSIQEEQGVNTLRTIIAFLEEFPNWEWSRIHPMADNLSRPDAERAYLGFTAIMEWVVQNIVRAKATGLQTMPDIMKTNKLAALQNHYSLEQWIDICEKLKGHFIAIDNSNLDRRHGVLGAFAIIGGQI